MAAEQAPSVAGSGLRPAFAAVRVRLGLVLALFAMAAVGWWWTVAQMQGWTRVWVPETSRTVADLVLHA